MKQNSWENIRLLTKISIRGILEYFQLFEKLLELLYVFCFIGSSVKNNYLNFVKRFIYFRDLQHIFYFILLNFITIRIQQNVQDRTGNILDENEKFSYVNFTMIFRYAYWI